MWPYPLKKPDFSDLGCSSGQVLSKTKSVTPHFFYISDITNSSSFNGKICRKKSMLENFRTNDLKYMYMYMYRSLSTSRFIRPKDNVYA